MQFFLRVFHTNGMPQLKPVHPDSNFYDIFYRALYALQEKLDMSLKTSLAGVFNP